MTDFIQIKTPEDVDKIEPVDFDNVTNGFTIRMQEGAKHYHLGSLNVSRLIKEINPCYKVLKKILRFF